MRYNEMSTILVYDVAAENGGAKSVLLRYYEKAKADPLNFYIFVLSTISLPDTKNIKTLNLKWVKKSWVHRIVCDLFTIKKIVRDYKVDEVLSLQNTAIRVDKKQTVYVHNAIPFSEARFNLFKDPFLWFYKHVVGTIITSSLKKASKIIVQCDWMKDKVCKKCRINPDIIAVERLTISPYDKTIRRIESKKTLFFYPATPFSFKNHWVILNAARSLGEYLENYEIVFTIDENDRAFRKQKAFIKKHELPVRFVGQLSKDEMYSYYSGSVLVFASVLETVGLPLVEAKSVGATIFCSEMEFARESLGSYPNVFFFNPYDPVKLKELMAYKIKEDL